MLLHGSINAQRLSRSRERLVHVLVVTFVVVARVVAVTPLTGCSGASHPIVLLLMARALTRAAWDRQPGSRAS